MTRTLRYLGLTALIALGLWAVAPAQVLNAITAAALQSRSWIFTAVQTFSGGIKTPARIGTNYTMATPASAPTVITSGTVSANCVNTKSYEWYTASVNAAGVSALSPASVAWVPSPNAKKATVTRVSAAAPNELGWLVYMRVNGAGSFFLERVSSASGPATLEDGFIASGTTTATVFCSEASMTYAAAQGLGCTASGVPISCCTGSGTGTCTAGQRDTMSLDVTHGIIKASTTSAGPNIPLITPDVRQLDLSGVALRFSSDSGGTWGSVSSPVRVVTICASGCAYTTLNAACAAETSTAALPILYSVGPGLYTIANACSGEDHATFWGAGMGTSYLDSNGDSGATGTLNMGTSTNYVIQGFTIEGHIPITANAAGTGGGKIIIRENEFIVEGVQSSFEDCFRGDQFAAGTDLTLENNVCNSTQDGFTIAQDAKNVRVHSINNRWVDPTNTPTGTMKLWRLDSIPCFFESIGDSQNVTASRTAPFGLQGYDFETASTGSCAANGKAYISGATSLLTNTTQNQGGSYVGNIAVDSGATTLTEIHVLNSEMTSTATDSGGNDTSVRSVVLVNATTAGFASGGRYRSSGGTLNTDFTSGAAGKWTLVGVDYLTDDGTVVSNTVSDQSGSATFAAATTKAVTLPVTEPDTAYIVTISCNANKTFWVTSKGTTGFTLNASSSSSDTCDWRLKR